MFLLYWMYGSCMYSVHVHVYYTNSTPVGHGSLHVQCILHQPYSSWTWFLHVQCILHQPLLRLDMVLACTVYMYITPTLLQLGHGSCMYSVYYTNPTPVGTWFLHVQCILHQPYSVGHGSCMYVYITPTLLQLDMVPALYSVYYTNPTPVGHGSCMYSVYYTNPTPVGHGSCMYSVYYTNPTPVGHGSCMYSVYYTNPTPVGHGSCMYSVYYTNPTPVGHGSCMYSVYYTNPTPVGHGSHTYIVQCTYYTQPYSGWTWVPQVHCTLHQPYSRATVHTCRLRALDLCREF